MSSRLLPYKSNRGAPPDWLAVVVLILAALWLLNKIIP